MKPIQITINGVDLPFTSRDKYRPRLEDKSESIRMANGRLVTEEQARIWVVEYEYDKMKDELMVRLLSILRTHNELDVTFLVPDDGIQLSRTMQCTKWPQPTMAFAVAGEPRWHNMTFTLEAVEGEDYA